LTIEPLRRWGVMRRPSPPIVLNQQRIVQSPMPLLVVATVGTAKTWEVQASEKG
jgi:hypothetical protein